MACLDEGSIQLLPSETIRHNEKIGGGTLILTDYRLLFLSGTHENTWNVILLLICKADVVELTCLRITTKLGLSLMCFLENETTCERWVELITNAFDKPIVGEDSFCVTFRSALQERIPEHPFLFRSTRLLYEIEDVNSRLAPQLVCREYKRMNFGSVWRVTEANQCFKICSSYPEYHIIPSDVQDSAISKMADFRTHRRFPSVVWRSQNTGAVILRCAEPRVGLMCNRNEYDEQFISCVSKCCLKDPGRKPFNTDPPRLLIVDARTFRMAQFKRLWGGGFEYSDYYDEAEVCFMDMPNIHAVRLSFERLTQLYTSDSDTSWFSNLERTCWLGYISQLLKNSTYIASVVESGGRPVMVHCTDGWDRTAQLSSLAQLLADPYYRTIEGFRVLIEREWLHFGHKFGDRCGQCTNFLSGDERSPVFLQWLDCIHQVRLQFPDQFEFNETFLVKLGVHVYSGLFGTFLCNSDRERQMAQVESRTCSIWGLLSGRFNQAILNHFYEPSKRHLLEPDWRLPCLRLWNSLYRSAFLPSCRISTGVISLNKTVSVCAADILRPVDSDRQLDQSIRSTVPDLEVCFESSVDKDIKGVTNGNFEVDKVNEHQSPQKIDESQNGLHPRTFLGDLSNTSELIPTYKRTATSDELFDNVFDHCALLSVPRDLPVPNTDHSCEFETNVAILPLASANEDTSPGVGLVNSRNSSSSPNLPVLLETLQKGSVVPIRSVPSCEDILFREPRSPCLRNCSFSTDDGGGVFVADEEIDRCCGVIRTPSSFSFDRKCFVDNDDEVISPWDTRISLNHHGQTEVATSPIVISSKSDPLSHLPVIHCDSSPQLNIRNRTRIPPHHESNSTSSADVSTDCQTHVKNEEKSVETQRPELNKENTFDADYTMHSLPEGEMLLINETATDYEDCLQSNEPSPVPSETNCSSNDTRVAPDSVTFPGLCLWTDRYFSKPLVPDPLCRPLDLSVPGNTNHLCPFGLHPTVDSANEQHLSARPVSAPISPAADAVPSSCFSTSSFSYRLNQGSCAVDLFRNSATTVCPKESGSRKPSCRSSLDETLGFLDWDGLPSVTNPSNYCIHLRKLDEQKKLALKVAQLTEELIAVRSKLEAVTAVSNLANNPAVTTFAGHQNLNSSVTISAISGMDERPPINCRISATATVSSSLGVRRFSSHSDVSSFEFVDTAHPSSSVQLPASSEEVIGSSGSRNHTCKICLTSSCDGCTVEPSWSNGHVTNLIDSSACRSCNFSRSPHPYDSVSGRIPPDVRQDLIAAIDQVQSTPDQTHPLPLAHPLPNLYLRGSTTALSLQSRSQTGLLSAVSSSHLATNGSLTAPARCCSAGGTRPATSPTTPDGVAQA